MYKYRVWGKLIKIGFEIETQCLCKQDIEKKVDMKTWSVYHHIPMNR